TAFAYNAGRRISTITYPDTSTRVYTYDGDFNVLTETDPNGDVVTHTYDENGNRASTTDGAGHVTLFAYDALDRLTVINEPVGMTSMTYDVRGRVTSVSDANGMRFAVGYDAGGRIGTLTDGAGNVWTHTYDAAGRPLTTTNPLGVVVSSTYDSRGRPMTFVDGRGNSTVFEWDSMQRPIKVTDATGAETTYGYDAAGDLISIALPGGISASYTRVLGQMASITDPRGEVWSFGRDAAGRLVSATDPLGAETTYSYDAMGQNSGVAFPGLMGSLTVTRDSTGNMTQQSYSDGTTIDFSYDENGRRVSGTGLSLAYDGNGNIIESNGIAVARDSGSRVSTVTLAPGKVLTYTYDARNLVTRIQDWAGGEVNFTYDAAGRLVSVDRSNGVATTLGYDDNNVLTGINDAMGAVELSDIQLVRDPLGRATLATRVLPLSPTAPDAGPAYTYDAALQIQGFTYDDLGRLLSDDRRDYDWDLASRLTSIGGGVDATDFEHDGWGSLVSRTQGGVTKTFVWNYAFSFSAMSIERTDGVDSTYYVYTPDGRLWYSINAADDSRRFYHFDEMGSTNYTTDDSGLMVNAYAYGPYGALVDAMEPEPNLFTYVGQLGVMREASTGLYHMRRRVYDSLTRRFISREPLLGLLDPRALNPYQYAFNNPQQYADPTGENPKDQKNSGSDLMIEASDVTDATNWVTYGTEKMIDAAKALNDADIEKIAGQRKNILEVAKLQQLGNDLDGVGKVADGVGTAADLVGDGLEVYSVYEDTSQIKNETLTLNDLALQNLNNQTQTVLELLNREKGINPARAELLLASVRRAFERTVRGTTASGVAGIELRLWRGIQNTLANRLPPHVQEALKRAGVLEQ
ncbi:MAG: RHS repeat-associated core domain-containing protein, partial [Myxococcota bacterium]